MGPIIALLQSLGGMTGITSLLSLFGSFFGLKNTTAEQQLQQAQLDAQKDQALINALGNTDATQAQINLAAQQSGSFFASGWRNFIAWALGIDFIIQFPLKHIVQFIGAISGIHFEFPTNTDTDLIMTLISALLGLSLVYSRHIEKKNLLNTVSTLLPELMRQKTTVPDNAVMNGDIDPITGKPIWQSPDGKLYIKD